MATKAPIPADEVRALLKAAQSIAASVVPEEAEDVAAGVLAELWSLGISSPDGRKRWVAKRAKQRALNAKRDTDRRRELLARNLPREEATTAAVEAAEDKPTPKTAREVCLARAVAELRKTGVADPVALATDVRKLARYRPSAAARRHAEELRRERRRIEALARRYPTAGFKVPVRLVLLAPTGRSDRGSSRRSQVLTVICRTPMRAAQVLERLPRLTLQSATALAVLAEPDLFLPKGTAKAPAVAAAKAWKRASVNVRSALGPLKMPIERCEAERQRAVEAHRKARATMDEALRQWEAQARFLAAACEGLTAKFLKPQR